MLTGRLADRPFLQISLHGIVFLIFVFVVGAALLVVCVVVFLVGVIFIFVAYAGYVFAEVFDRPSRFVGEFPYVARHLGYFVRPEDDEKEHCYNS